MASSKGPIYKEEGCIGNAELLGQLKISVEELEVKMKASKAISRGGHPVGFGVDKLQRGIAADKIISIAKAIKSLKGW